MKKATREQTKTHNLTLVLKTIYDQGPISRADIARATGLTRTTVSGLVAEIIDEGLVEEVGVQTSTGGKPGTLLSVVDDSRHLIGIDLANSEFRGSILDLRGRVRQKISLPVQERNGSAALSLVYQLLDRLLPQASSPVLGIGIGTPGLIDARQGIIRTAVNLDWQNLPLRDLLMERYGLPVYVANDSQVAALGEYTFGRSTGTPNLVVVKIGRGIGAGIIINGRLFHGDGFGAGEIGHVRVVDNNIQCRCGHYGCLETVVSSRALLRQARQIAVQSPDSLLHPYAGAPEQINTEMVLEAFHQGDPHLQAVVRQMGHHLAVAVAHLVNALNIHHIVIAGSLARFGEALLEPIRTDIQHRAMALLAEQTRIELSVLDQDIVIQGAAALLLSQELGIV
ncbi:MAG: ROK family transcriptional regulator [Chloroflexi bacterium]|nr:MAG: ROK family transcriptional regulator [Chloroflexota bacterium]